MNYISKKIRDLIDNTSKSRAAKELLFLSDKQLADIGLSRVKLSQGASAYPWKGAEVVTSINFSISNSSTADAKTSNTPGQQVA